MKKWYGLVLAGVALASVLGTTQTISADTTVKKYNVNGRQYLNNPTYGVTFSSNPVNQGANGVASNLKVTNNSRTVFTNKYTKGKKTTKVHTDFFIPEHPLFTYSYNNATKAVTNFKLNDPVGGNWVPQGMTYVGSNLYIQLMETINGKDQNKGVILKYDATALKFIKGTSAMRNTRGMEIALYDSQRYLNTQQTDASQMGYRLTNMYNPQSKKISPYDSTTNVSQYAALIANKHITYSKVQNMGHGGAFTSYKNKLYLLNYKINSSKAAVLQRYSVNNLNTPNQKVSVKFSDPWSGYGIKTKTVPNNIAFDKNGNIYFVSEYQKGSGNQYYHAAYGIFKGKLSGKKLSAKYLPLRLKNSYGAVGVQGIAFDNYAKRLYVLGNSASLSIKMSSFEKANSGKKYLNTKKANRYKQTSNKVSKKVTSSFETIRLNNSQGNSSLNREIEAMAFKGSTSYYLGIGSYEVMYASSKIGNVTK